MIHLYFYFRLNFMIYILFLYIHLHPVYMHTPLKKVYFLHKELTRPCRYSQCKCVSVACNCAPIKVDGPLNSKSSIDERAIIESNLTYYQ